MMEKEIFQDLDWGRKNNKNEPNLMIKAFSKLRVGGDYVSIKEALNENPQQTLHSIAKDWPFPSMIRKKIKMTITSHFFLRLSGNSRNESKGVQI